MQSNHSEIQQQVGHPIYLVGGAVRDKLRGFVPKDYDYVVVGVSESYLISRNWVPNGKQFPVFLHPEFPGVQLAIARSDRKIAAGYNGFSWKAALSLHDDLFRRDFTCNAMAETLEGELIDPFESIAHTSDNTSSVEKALYYFKMKG